MESTGGARDRGTVRSVSNSMDILEELSHPRNVNGMSLTEVAASVDIAKSTARALLQTLNAHGMVAVDGEGTFRRYRLGTALIRLGESARESLSLPRISQPEVRRLAQALDMSARVALLDGTSAVTVLREDPPHRARINLHMGQRELLHSSSVGKAILAEMSDGEVRALLERTGMGQRTERTITDVDTFLTDLRAVRQRGFSIDDEEDAPGIVCVGAAIRARDGQCAGAVSVTCKKSRLDDDISLEDLGVRIQLAAEHISALLGYVGVAGNDAQLIGR